MSHSKKDREDKYRALLASDDDIALFSQGGCGVFAGVLHLKFCYRLRFIPGHGSGISHVYAHLDGDPEYAVDVEGTKIGSDRVGDFGGICAPFLSLDELWTKFGRIEEDGLLGEEWFTIPATVRACARIEKYRPYFDGSKKEHIPK